MKTVGIIGAGPAGMVVAKTFLCTGSYDVTVFEAADRAGGMWRSMPGEYGEKCSPEMRTNLSRFTVAFSDLSWSSVNLSGSKDHASESGRPPMFPRAWQVGQYLRTYAKKFGVEAVTKYSSRVTKVKYMTDSSSWQVIYMDSNTKEERTEHFDYLIIASGFFGKPTTRAYQAAAYPSNSFQHSSQFRDIKTLTPWKIAVIGGGISGSEAAAQAAFQVSSARFSAPQGENIHANTKIYHIINRPFYDLPRYLPQNPHNPDIQDYNLAPEFLPIDLALYNLDRRSTGDISAATSTVPPEKTKKGHEFMRSVIGGDHRDLGRSELVYRPEHLQYPGYTGITDTYSEFIRSGVIVPVRGWVEDVRRNQEDETYSLSIASKTPWSRDQDEHTSTVLVANGVIEATGYETNLSFLDAEIKEQLDFDLSCPRVPVILTRGSIFAKRLPTLAFVGFYEGPYWTVMELQARLICEQWSKIGHDHQNPNIERFFQQNDAMEMRKAIQAKSLQVPQFWMMDYVGLVEELARATNTQRMDSPFGGQLGPAFASRYTSANESRESDSVVQDVVATLDASRNTARFVAAAVFRGMQGIWKLKRKIDSQHTAAPGGTLDGSAHFHPRVPTSPNFAAEYLYIEEGTFKMDSGLSFPASRRYVYRYNEITDKISAWFVDEDGVSVGALFNTWQFCPPEDGYHGWMATGHHWCDPDTYKNTCEFRFRGAAVQSFGIIYQVEGPQKDYTHESWYERPQAEYR